MCVDAPEEVYKEENCHLFPGGLSQTKKETRKHWVRDLGAADHQLWHHTRTSLMCSANKH